MPQHTQYEYQGKHYLVSYSLLGNETAIFPCDERGNPLGYKSLWSFRGYFNPEKAMLDFLDINPSTQPVAEGSNTQSRHERQQ